MFEDGYCQIFVDADVEPNSFRVQLAEVLGGRIAGFTIHAGCISVDVKRNKAFDPAKSRRQEDGFLYFPVFLDVLPAGQDAEAGYIEAVARLLELLRNAGHAAVAMCDFEDMLRRAGGVQNL